jgi:hypothetical protein
VIASFIIDTSTIVFDGKETNAYSITNAQIIGKINIPICYTPQRICAERFIIYFLQFLVL